SFRIGIEIERARLPAGALAVRKNFGDRRHGMAAPALELHRADETAVFANELPVVFRGVQGVAPEAVVHAERKREHLLERHRRGFREPLEKLGISNRFEIADAFEEMADGPALLPQDALPMLRKHVEHEHDDDADAQRGPENFHSVFSPDLPGCKMQRETPRLWRDSTRSLHCLQRRQAITTAGPRGPLRPRRLGGQSCELEMRSRARVYFEADA